MNFFDQFTAYSNGQGREPELFYVLLGGLVVASLFAVKPLLRYLFARGTKKEVALQTIVNVHTLDINAIKELLAVSRAEVAPKNAATSVAQSETRKPILAAYDVLKAAVTLSKFRNLLRPTEPLTRSMFPSDMRVLKFVPEKLLVIALPASHAEKGCLAAFSVLHWTLFPGIAGGCLFGLLLGSSGSWIGSLIGAGVGIFFWIRLVRRGPYIRINLQKKTYAVISVASASWYAGPPTAEIQSVRDDNGWVATVIIAGQAVSMRTATKAQEDAEGELRPFVTALNWQLTPSGKREPVVSV